MTLWCMLWQQDTHYDACYDKKTHTMTHIMTLIHCDTLWQQHIIWCWHTCCDTNTCCDTMTHTMTHTVTMTNCDRLIPITVLFDKDHEFLFLSTCLLVHTFIKIIYKYSNNLQRSVLYHILFKTVCKCYMCTSTQKGWTDFPNVGQEFLSSCHFPRKFCQNVSQTQYSVNKFSYYTGFLTGSKRIMQCKNAWL